MKLTIFATLILSGLADTTGAGMVTIYGRPDHRIISVTEVNIGGTLYDAYFDDFNSFEVFAAIPHFQFTNEINARLATTALIEAINTIYGAAPLPGRFNDFNLTRIFYVPFDTVGSSIRASADTIVQSAPGYDFLIRYNLEGVGVVPNQDVPVWQLGNMDVAYVRFTQTRVTTAIPEPSSLIMFATCLLGGLISVPVVRWRRQAPAASTASGQGPPSRP